MVTFTKKTSSLKEFKVQIALGTLVDNKKTQDMLVRNLNFFGRFKLVLWLFLKTFGKYNKINERFRKRYSKYEYYKFYYKLLWKVLWNGRLLNDS